MKTIFTILSFALVAGLMAFSDPFKNSTGAQPGHTGSPGDGANCTACHPASASTIDGVFSSNIPVTGYAPGSTYTITVTTSGAGRKGFQVSPQNITGDLLGTLAAGSGNKLVGNNKYVTHSSGITSPTAQWSFSWTAPEVGTGSVTFYGAFVIGYSNPIRLSTMEVQEDETIGIGNIAGKSFNILPLAGSNLISLSYHLAEPANLEFELFDLAGRVVMKRNFGWQHAGNFSDDILIEPNPRKNIYIAVITAGRERISKKIIL